MTGDDRPIEDDRTPGGSHSSSSFWVLLGMVSLIVAGILAYVVLRTDLGPAPADIANDSLLVEGRVLFLERCVSCHGESGRGDGPIAASLSGLPPGDLTDDEWKHGDRPQDVLTVINLGVQGTSMPGWRATFRTEQINAIAAYVYHLSGRTVPESLRPSTEGAPAVGDESGIAD